MANDIKKTLRFVGLCQIMEGTETGIPQYVYIEHEAFTIRKGVRDGAFVIDYFHPSNLSWVNIKETR